MDESRKIDRRDFIKYSGLSLAALGLSQFLAGCAPKQKDYPTRPITWWTYQQPGGSLDTTTRLLIPYMQSHMGVPVVSDYEVGAGGRTLRTSTYKAQADGYRLMTDEGTSALIGEVIYDGQYKTKEFTHLGGWTRQGYVWCVKKDSPIRTFDDLVAEFGKRRVTVGNLGAGSTGHLQLEIYKDELDMNFEIVHFDGSTPTYTALLGGHIDCAYSGAASASRNRDNLHIIAVQDPEGDPVITDVDSMKKMGYDSPVIMRKWLAFTTPKVPAERAAMLVESIKLACQNDDHNERQAKAGVPVTYMTPESLAADFENSMRIVETYKELLMQASG